LILLLLGPNPANIQGCHLAFPDSAFFTDGKVSEIIKTDKDGFLTNQKFDARSGIQDIRTSFTSIVRERRKDTASELL